MLIHCENKCKHCYDQCCMKSLLDDLDDTVKINYDSITEECDNFEEGINELYTNKEKRNNLPKSIIEHMCWNYRKIYLTDKDMELEQRRWEELLKGWKQVLIEYNIPEEEYSTWNDETIYDKAKELRQLNNKRRNK